MDINIVTCFSLGRALRYGDAEAFFGVYDGLLDGREEADISESQVSVCSCWNQYTCIWNLYTMHTCSIKQCYRYMHDICFNKPIALLFSE